VTLPPLAHQNRPDPTSCSEQQPKARSPASSRQNRAFNAKLAPEAATHRHQHRRSKRAIDEVRGRLVDARLAARLRESSRDAAELAGCSHHTVRRYLAGSEQGRRCRVHGWPATGDRSVLGRRRGSRLPPILPSLDPHPCHHRRRQGVIRLAWISYRHRWTGALGPERSANVVSLAGRCRVSRLRSPWRGTGRLPGLPGWERVLPWP
jgi:hypothetical protein